MPDRLPRAMLRAALEDRATPPPPGLRAPCEADIPALGALMHGAYRGTVDSEDETLEQAIDEVRKTFRGDYGAFVADASVLAERDGRLLAATLVTRWEDRPFVAFTMTDPSAKRQGFARACMAEAMNRLVRRGERELRLVVTLANTPALALYESLGFRPEPRPPSPQGATS